MGPGNVSPFTASHVEQGDFGVSLRLARNEGAEMGFNQRGILFFRMPLFLFIYFSLSSVFGFLLQLPEEDWYPLIRLPQKGPWKAGGEQSHSDPPVDLLCDLPRDLLHVLLRVLLCGPGPGLCSGLLLSGAVGRQAGGGPDFFIDSHPFHRKEEIHFKKVRHAALL